MNKNSTLKGMKALIVGVANERSLGWSIAKQLHQAGVKLGFTYIGEKLKDRLIPMFKELDSDFIEPCDVSQDHQIAEVFQELKKKWNTLDILIHSVAFTNREDLQGRFINTPRQSFQTALDISTYSLIALAHHAEPLFPQTGASIVTLSYYGSQKVIPHYHIMGVAKAALEASVRYLAYDLGPQKIRVNAISAGPVKTLSARALKDFNSMLSLAAEKSPLQENIQAEDVGQLATFLCSPAAKHITGSTIYLDSGAHIMGV